MKNAVLLILFSLCLLASAPPAGAAYIVGEELARSCNSEAPSDIFTCLGYIEGVIDYQVVMDSLGTAPTTDFCLPENLPVEKAALTVMHYLKQSPQDGSFIAASAVVMALHKTYPCAAAPPRHKKKK